jgi:Insertion element 4 transposase N-terminal
MAPARLTSRLTVAMTVMPDAGYAETARRLAGHLADVPWVREWHVPGSKVFTEWRDKAGPAPVEDLFWRIAGPLIDDDAPSAVLLAGMPVHGIDGMVVNVADTPANRAAFGCAGTRTRKGYGEAPFPQIQAVIVTARAGRAIAGTNSAFRPSWNFSPPDGSPGGSFLVTCQGGMACVLSARHW